MLIHTFYTFVVNISKINHPSILCIPKCIMHSLFPQGAKSVHPKTEKSLSKFMKSASKAECKWKHLKLFVV